MAKVNIDVGGGKDLPDVKIPVSGALDTDDLLKVNEIEVESSTVDSMDRIAMLAFFEEPVKIRIHETTNPADDQLVFCSVNGEGADQGNPWLVRGRDYVLKRKFVNDLFTSRRMTYSQPYKDETKEKANYMRPHSAVRNPFSVIADSNPKGVAWLQQINGG